MDQRRHGTAVYATRHAARVGKYTPRRGNEGKLCLRNGALGKLLFVVYACLPEEQEATILRYTQKDYAWALASEWAIWKYLVDEQLLYNTGEDTKQSLLHEGPFTRGLPQESPDRMGQFLGYRMVKQYMDDNDVTLEQLISTPYLKILQAYEAPEKK